MDESADMTTERVDDIPLLVAQMCRMGLPVLLECNFPVHGNRGGLNVGWTAVVWLAHILSQGDHRLNQVQPWVARRLETLRACTGQSIKALDLTDDRLADVLRTLADDTHWANFERVLGQEVLRVYDLAPACVRVDMTTVSQAGPVTQEGLFQCGYSKDRWPDAPQVKVGLATLDPLGLPLASLVVPGDRADDPLYVPLIKQARAVVGRRGVLYVGDCRDDHVTGLIRLLTIALRVLTTLDYAARAPLDQEQRALPGLYAGNPTRATRRPTAELLLAAFKDITLTVVRTPQVTLRHLTALSPTQHGILALLGFTPAVYASIEHYVPQPP